MRGHAGDARLVAFVEALRRAFLALALHHDGDPRDEVGDVPLAVVVLLVVGDRRVLREEHFLQVVRRQLQVLRFDRVFGLPRARLILLVFDRVVVQEVHRLAATEALDAVDALEFDRDFWDALVLELAFVELHVFALVQAVHVFESAAAEERHRVRVARRLLLLVQLLLALLLAEVQLAGDYQVVRAFRRRAGRDLLVFQRRAMRFELVVVHRQVHGELPLDDRVVGSADGVDRVFRRGVRHADLADVRGVPEDLDSAVCLEVFEAFPELEHLSSAGDEEVEALAHDDRKGSAFVVVGEAGQTHVEVVLLFEFFEFVDLRGGGFPVLGVFGGEDDLLISVAEVEADRQEGSCELADYGDRVLLVFEVESAADDASFGAADDVRVVGGELDVGDFSGQVQR